MVHEMLTNVDHLTVTRQKMTRLSAGLLSVLVILILISIPPPAETCSCSKKHPQEHYCSADFGKLKK